MPLTMESIYLFEVGRGAVVQKNPDRDLDKGMFSLECCKVISFQLPRQTIGFKCGVTFKWEHFVCIVFAST